MSYYPGQIKVEQEGGANLQETATFSPPLLKCCILQYNQEKKLT